MHKSLSDINFDDISGGPEERSKSANTDVKKSKKVTINTQVESSEDANMRKSSPRMYDRNQ